MSNRWNLADHSGGAARRRSEERRERQRMRRVAAFDATTIEVSLQPVAFKPSPTVADATVRSVAPMRHAGVLATETPVGEDSAVRSEQTSTPAEARLVRPSRPPRVDGQSRIIWGYVVAIVVFHLLIPVAFLPYFFSWWGLFLLPVGNFVFCSLGIGAGLHRLHTHRSYECPLWFERMLALLGCCNLQQSPVRWVLVHRLHHQHSDHASDPHTPHVSWFWGHVGWLFIENRELSSLDTYEHYAKDMLSDPFYRRLERNQRYLQVYAVHAIAFAVAGYVVGLLLHGANAGAMQVSLQWLLWGVVIRTVYTWNVTWGVNSFCHLFGYRNYETRDDSRNNWLFALATSGDGWHNNHHADPTSAAHGFHCWWEFDLTFVVIRCWEKLGLAWGIKPITASRAPR